MARNCPYKFPLRSRAAMIDYILNRHGYSDNWITYKFAWNVKAHTVNTSRPKGENELQDKHQAAWDKYLANGADVFSQACEDAGRYLSDGEWTSYPGNDQGAWEFGFEGRMAGWLILLKWNGRDMRTLDHYDLDHWETSTVRELYRGLVCADADFTQAKAAENVEFYLNDIRHAWEEERDAEHARAVDSAVARMISERPDLYPGACA